MAVERIGLENLKPAPGARKRSKRLGMGLGSGHGKTATRGTKGQTSRSGDGKMIGFEGGQTPRLRRIPKRGFTNGPFRVRYQIVALADLVRVFQNQTEVTLDAMRVHGLVKGRDPVKVLGDGELSKAMKVQAHAFSKSAQEKIQKAGGSAEKVEQ
jgi:large subunit ribosomal protein L15